MTELTHTELVARYAPLVARGDSAIAEHLARRSATFDAEYYRRQRVADDMHAPFDRLAALLAADKAERAVSNNELSIPLAGNHFAAILRYEGRAAWEAAVRAQWKRDPKHAQLIGLPELPRLGA